MWLGPAPRRPFNPNRFHFNFRWFWDYAGGLMMDWGVHEIDVALWVMDAEAPQSVMASGGKVGYADDADETPDTQGRPEDLLGPGHAGVQGRRRGERPARATLPERLDAAQGVRPTPLARATMRAGKTAPCPRS
jgi:predicted dehydrogenase